MPIDNKKVQNQPLPQVLPKHPHRNLYILLTTLAVVTIYAIFYLYNSKQIKYELVTSPPNEKDVQVEGLKILSEKINNNVTKEEELAGLKVLVEKNKRINK